MAISEVKKYVGQKCDVLWLDRTGREIHVISMIHDVTFVPLYGGYIITDTEDIRLDKVVAVQLCQLSEVSLAA